MLREKGSELTAHVSVDALVRREALRLGFDVVGVARADEPLTADFARYEGFIADEKHGSMAYLAAEPEARRRLDGEAILPGARSVICVGKRYARAAEDEAKDPPFSQRVARYARGQDYHNFLRKKLRRLAAFVRGLDADVRARPLCDEEPVLERAWAARAGLGFVGKNGLIIAPGQGSFLLLGEVVTTLVLRADTPIGERCGACTRCLDACPTSAFDAPFVLDPRRCIAYLTIEAEGIADEPLRAATGEHLFGCDVCQEVCPWNRTSPPAADAVRAFRPHERFEKMGLPAAIAANDEEFSSLTVGSPLHRAGPLGLARNALVVAGNEVVPSEDGAQAIARGLAHPDPDLRELARWAKARRDVRVTSRPPAEGFHDPA